MPYNRLNSFPRSLIQGVIACALAGSLGSCQSTKPPPATDVDQALTEASRTPVDDSNRTQSTTGRPADQHNSAAAASPPVVSAATSDDDVIAYVNDVAISRSRLTDLLIAGHGVGILEQLMVLERAKAVAAQQGVNVTGQDVQDEYDRSLRGLLSPLQPAEVDAPFDHDQAEELLDDILSRRNISRREYMLGMTRNAYLRAIVLANMTFDDTQIRSEYESWYALRVEIRHIQLASPADAQRVAALLAGGSDFGAVARDYSANLRTASAGGLLAPFTANDPDVPPAVRDTAFTLQPGDVSNPIRVDDWYHIIKLERRIDAEPLTLEQARPELEQRLRRRLIEPAMQTLYRTLFAQADIRIVDQTLAEQFRRKHPKHQVGAANADFGE